MIENQPYERVKVDGIEYKNAIEAIRNFIECGLSVQTMRKRLILRPECDSSWLTRPRAQGSGGGRKSLPVTVEGVEYESVEMAASAYINCSVPLHTLIRRIQEKPGCTREWITRKPSSRIETHASRYVDPGEGKPKVSINGSELTYAHAAYYISRMSKRCPIVITRDGRIVSVTPASRHTASVNDLGTFHHASQCDILRELEE